MHRAPSVYFYSYLIIHNDTQTHNNTHGCSPKHGFTSLRDTALSGSKWALKYLHRLMRSDRSSSWLSPWAHIVFCQITSFYGQVVRTEKRETFGRIFKDCGRNIYFIVQSSGLISLEGIKWHIQWASLSMLITKWFHICPKLTWRSYFKLKSLLVSTQLDKYLLVNVSFIWKLHVFSLPFYEKWYTAILLFLSYPTIS